MELGEGLEGFEVLQELIVLNPRDSSLEVSSTPSKDYKYWSSDNTKILIDCYAKYKKKVGTLEIRSMKKLWEIIATEMKQITNENMTTTNCENRWKVLERNYKAFVDNKKKTGRGRKVFEFSQEMDQIFAKKKNVNPELLLESETVEQNIDVSCHAEEMPQFEQSQQNREEINEAPKEISRKSTLKRKNSKLTKIREEKKEYYQRKLNIESERLQVEQEKLQEMKRRNDLLEERNNILKIYGDKGMLSEFVQ